MPTASEIKLRMMKSKLLKLQAKQLRNLEYYFLSPYTQLPTVVLIDSSCPRQPVNSPVKLAIQITYSIKLYAPFAANLTSVLRRLPESLECLLRPVSACLRPSLQNL